MKEIVRISGVDQAKSTERRPILDSGCVGKLECLAVYGRASMAAFCQLSTHIVPPRSNVREARLNTHGHKFDPESLYEPIKFEICSHIWSTNINFRPLLHWTFWSILV